MKETYTSVLYISAAALFTVSTFGSLAILLILHLNRSNITKLFDLLRTDSLLKPRKEKDLTTSLVYISYALTDFSVCLIIRFMWVKAILELPPTNVVSSASLWYSIFSLTMLLTFPLVLTVTTSYILCTSLKAANEVLAETLAGRGGPASLDSVPWQHALDTVSAQYRHLRRLHQQLSGIIAAPILIWTTDKFLTIVQMTFFMVCYSHNITLERCLVVFSMVAACSVSLYGLSRVADAVTLQVTH